MPVSMYPPVRRTMVGLLSTPRMATYLAATAGDVSEAVDLYRWNLDSATSLFESIHYLEVAVRNRVDEALVRLAGPGADWVDAPATVPLNPGTRQSVQRARDHALRERHDVTHGHVIAELTFGFWPYLFAGDDNRTLWQPALKNAFPGVARATLHDELKAVSRLRNRIAHHEPIFALDLAAEYARVLGAAEHVEPRLGWWIDSTSRVESVQRRRP